MLPLRVGPAQVEIHADVAGAQALDQTVHGVGAEFFGIDPPSSEDSISIRRQVHRSTDLVGESGLLVYLVVCQYPSMLPCVPWVVRCSERTLTS